MKFEKIFQKLQENELFRQFFADAEYVPYKQLKKMIKQIKNAQIHGHVEEANKIKLEFQKTLEMVINTIEEFTHKKVQQAQEELDEYRQKKEELKNNSPKEEEEEGKEEIIEEELRINQNQLRENLRYFKSLRKFCEINKEAVRKITKRLDKHDSVKEKNFQPTMMKRLNSLEFGNGKRIEELITKTNNEYEQLLDLNAEARKIGEDIFIEGVESPDISPRASDAKLTNSMRAQEKQQSFIRRHEKLIQVCIAIVLIMILPVFLAIFLSSFDLLKILLTIGILLAFVLGLANGANDICNSVGTVYGAKVLSLKQVVIWGVIFEVVGALTMGLYVSKTISKGIITPSQYEDDPNIFALCMVGVLSGAAVTTLLATIYGLPVSATHGVIGGLVAVGLVSKGASSIEGAGLITTVLSWVLSPACGLLVSFILYYIIAKFINLSPNPKSRAKFFQPFFGILTISVSVLFLLLKGLHFEPIWACVVIAIGAGIIVAFLLFCFQNKVNRCFNKTLENVLRVSKSDSDSQKAEAQSYFIPLLVISAFSVALAHGSNDVGNAVGNSNCVSNIFRTIGCNFRYSKNKYN
jgi:phosphate/sulfate permease